VISFWLKNKYVGTTLSYRNDVYDKMRKTNPGIVRYYLLRKNHPVWFINVWRSGYTEQ